MRSFIILRPHQFTWSLLDREKVPHQNTEASQVARLSNPGKLPSSETFSLRHVYFFQDLIAFCHQYFSEFSNYLALPSFSKLLQLFLLLKVQ